MRRKVKNEDSRHLNQTPPTSVNSSCHKGIQRNAFLLKTGFYCNIYITSGLPRRLKMQKLSAQNGERCVGSKNENLGPWTKLNQILYT